MARKIVIIGGVAGGASAAARARRICESCEIIIFDRGAFVSFANCGLPYYVGDVIADESKLLVATPELFRRRFNIEVRLLQEVIAIDRERREITVRRVESGETYRETYDQLVLSPGARAIRPPLPGVDSPGVFVLRTIPDSRLIRSWLQEKQARRAVVVGGGFVGMEMAENLHRRGLEVTIVEMAEHLLPSLDGEMAWFLQQRIESCGVVVQTRIAVTAIDGDADGVRAVILSDGTRLETDLVVLSVGVRPETALAIEAGIELGQSGGIRVDEQMRTNDPQIWAVGDAVEVQDAVTGCAVTIPLAGPANRQGRIAADSMAGREVRYRGTQGTAVCGCFGLTAASTGANQRALARAGVVDVGVVTLHPGHHVGYYPGAKTIHIKLLFHTQTGAILGAQMVGEEGVARRVDAVAMALQLGATVHDLAEAELCYAPQYGAAKDPVNVAGMIAVNMLRGDMPTASWDQLSEAGHGLIDVRSEAEFERGHIPGALNLPLDTLRHSLDQLPEQHELWLYCAVGQRAYYATRILQQCGYAVRNLPGGYVTYCALSSAGLLE